MLALFFYANTDLQSVTLRVRQNSESSVMTRSSGDRQTILPSNQGLNPLSGPKILDKISKAHQLGRETSKVDEQNCLRNMATSLTPHIDERPSHPEGSLSKRTDKVGWDPYRRHFLSGVKASTRRLIITFCQLYQVICLEGTKKTMCVRHGRREQNKSELRNVELDCETCQNETSTRPKHSGECNHDSFGHE